MKKTLLSIIAILTLIAACKKENNNTGTPDPKPASPSKMDLLCNEWILRETFEDDVPKTTNGTGRYQFTRDGKFNYYNSGSWGTAGTYQFNDADSNSISVLFTGTSSSYWMTINTLDKTNLKTEFIAGGKKMNYNYIR